MAKFLLLIFLIFLGLRILWRLFGPLLLVTALKKYARSVEAEATRRENMFQQKYDPQFEQEIHLNTKTKIKVPRKQDSNSKQSSIEDVDFEEIK